MYIFTPNTLIKSSEVNANFAELNSGDTAWLVPTLLNGWVTYDNNFNEAGYRKDSNGYVHLKGMIKNGSSTMFVLPVGYRPNADGRRLLMTGQGSGGLGRVDILSDGSVNYIGGGTEWFSLDGMIFKA